MKVTVRAISWLHHVAEGDPPKYSTCRPRDPGCGAAGWRGHLDSRAGTQIDRAIVGTGATGEDKGDARPVDGIGAADHEVAPVQDVGARVEIERGFARYCDSSAIDTRRNGLGFLLVQTIAGSGISRRE